VIVATSILISAVFALTGAGYLVRAVLGGASGIGRVSDLLHVLMSVAMLSMPWGWGMVFPTTLQEIVFGLATAFYVVLAISGPSGLGDAAPTAHAHHAGRGSLVFHAVMMAAMVLMAVQMSGSMTGASMSMPGMVMGSGAGGGVDTSGTAWTVLGWALAVFFGLAALRYLVALVRPVRAGERVLGAGAVRTNAALLLLMSAGMAVAFLPA
jgi:hypothetical protein